MPQFNPKLSLGLGLILNYFLEISIEIKRHERVPRRHKYAGEPTTPTIWQKIKLAFKRLLNLPYRLRGRHNQDSSFLKLPIEIRMQIYEVVFANPILLAYTCGTKWVLCEPAVLFTCRTIYEEGVKVLRRKTTLDVISTVDSSMPISCVINRLPIAMLNGLTKLRIFINLHMYMARPKESFFATEWSTLHNFPCHKFTSLTLLGFMIVSNSEHRRNQEKSFIQRTGIFGNNSMHFNLTPRSPWDRYGHKSLIAQLRALRGTDIRFNLTRRNGFVFTDNDEAIDGGILPVDAPIYVFSSVHNIDTGAGLTWRLWGNETIRGKWKRDMPSTSGHWDNWVMDPMKTYLGELK
jgi:hypothetical protein